HSAKKRAESGFAILLYRSVWASPSKKSLRDTCKRSVLRNGALWSLANCRSGTRGIFPDDPGIRIRTQEAKGGAIISKKFERAVEVIGHQVAANGTDLIVGI